MDKNKIILKSLEQLADNHRYDLAIHNECGWMFKTEDEKDLREQELADINELIEEYK